MSTLSEIYFNYNKAVSQARQLDSAAAKLKQAAQNDMTEILNKVYVSWKSDSSPQYIKKGEKVRNDIATTSRNLSSIAQAIRTIAERVKEAELEAWRIANERK